MHILRKDIGNSDREQSFKTQISGISNVVGGSTQKTFPGRGVRVFWNFIMIFFSKRAPSAVEY